MITTFDIILASVYFLGNGIMTGYLVIDEMRKAEPWSKLAGYTIFLLFGTLIMIWGWCSEFGAWLAVTFQVKFFWTFYVKKPKEIITFDHFKTIMLWVNQLKPRLNWKMEQWMITLVGKLYRRRFVQQIPNHPDEYIKTKYHQWVADRLKEKGKGILG